MEPHPRASLREDTQLVRRVEEGDVDGGFLVYVQVPDYEKDLDEHGGWSWFKKNKAALLRKKFPKPEGDGTEPEHWKGIAHFEMFEGVMNNRDEARIIPVLSEALKEAHRELEASMTDRIGFFTRMNSEKSLEALRHSTRKAMVDRLVESMGAIDDFFVTERAVHQLVDCVEVCHENAGGIRDAEAKLVAQAQAIMRRDARDTAASFEARLHWTKRAEAMWEHSCRGAAIVNRHVFRMAIAALKKALAA